MKLFTCLLISRPFGNSKIDLKTHTFSPNPLTSYGLFSCSQELKLIRWKTIIEATFASLHYSCAPVAAFISLVTVAATGTELTSYNTFMILSMISMLRITVLWNISDGVNIVADFLTAMGLIQGILECGDDSIHFANTIDSAGFDEIIKNDIHSHEDSTIVLENVVCSWSGNWNILSLKSVNLSVDKGELAFITGRVGAGKSSLLYAILGEIPLVSGKTSSVGKIAWVGQQPWVFSVTVRDNVLFGEPFDQNRYDLTLQACSLIKDLQRLPDGDLTVVGERGIVLSGGQQARVELARAVYSNADIYLLDDPLSAVDSKVGHDIFEKCINGVLDNKTRLMITHNLAALRDAKHIVVMEEGSILAKGDFSTLCTSGFDLDTIVQRAEQKPGNKQIKKPLNQGPLESERKSVQEYARLEIAEEDRMIGSVSWKLYWHYIQAGLHCILASAFANFFLIVQGRLIRLV